MDVLHCRKQENLEKALHLALKAVIKGAEVIVFPEVFSTGFCYEKLHNSAESLPSPTLENLACFSEANNCILIGSIIQKVIEEDEEDEEDEENELNKKNEENELNEKNGFTNKEASSEEEANHFTEKKNDVAGNLERKGSKSSARYYNLGFCFESGTLAGTYRKTHPFKKENKYFSRGNSIEPIPLKKQNLKIGLEICYELRFPEIARKLALAGSDLLITTAAFPNPKSEHWKILVRARAVENQIPHIACNRMGSAPGISYFGNSMIVDSLGEVKADAGDKESVIVCDIDLSTKDEIRKEVPVFKDRRVELYYR
jgi:predicted amidohydrolase